MKKSCCVDTNVLLEGYDFKEYDKIYIPIKVLEEIDNLKLSDSHKKAFRARRALRNLRNELKDKASYIVNFDGEGCSYVEWELPAELDSKKPDNIILYYVAKIQLGIDENAILLSYDSNMIEKAKALNIDCQLLLLDEKPYIYKGYKEIYLSDEELAYLYEHLNENMFDCVRNEYLLINDKDGNTIDKYKWDGLSYKQVKFKPINNQYTGKIKPRNKYQELVFDLLQDDSITVKILSGVFGSGKDFLMATHALNYIINGKYDKIIFIRNTIEVKDTKPIGFLPGTLVEKLAVFAMPLADSVGGIDGLNLLISQGKVELQHLGHIRGRSLSNCIVICSESENMTREHMQLLISRMAENSTLWINGDYKQIDDIVFEANNGFTKAINKLKGNELFGHVRLDITERSKTANLSSLLDE